MSRFLRKNAYWTILFVGLFLGVALSQGADLVASAYFSDQNLQAQPASWAASSGKEITSFADLAKKVQPAVVNIATTKIVRRRFSPFPRFGPNDPFDDFFDRFFDGAPREQKQNSLGSGFIINKEGYILTNNHVVERADEVVVHLADGRQLKAETIGTDPESDLAVIKIKTPEDLPFVPLGDSDAVEPGEWAMAIGNPFGFEHTVTVGVVSAKGRIVGGSHAPYARFIQTDASINPGNSGGPLFNSKGEVIGINTMIYGMGTGIGFAIPVNLAKELVPQLISKGSVTRGWLGVTIQAITPELAKSFGMEPDANGVIVSDIFPDSPAAKSELKRGDVIIEYNGKPVDETFDLTLMVARTGVGKTAKLKVLRNGEETVVKVKIGKRDPEIAGGKEPTERDIEGDIVGLVVRNLRLDEQREFGLSDRGGVMVQRVEPSSAAESANVREGDILLELNGKQIRNTDDYQKATQSLKKGDIARLLLRRGSATIYVAFTLR